MDDLRTPPPTPPENGGELPLDAPLLPRPEPPSLAHKIFIGPAGLRSGWRFLVYLAMVAALIYLLGNLAGYLVHARRGMFNPWLNLTQEVVLFLSVLIPALVMGKFEKRSLADYGLPPGRAFSAQFWEGMLWGIAGISLLIAGLHLAHAFDYGTLALHGKYLLKWAAFWCVFFLFVGLFEEFGFRGYTLYTLTTGMRFWPAALVRAAL